MDPNKDKAKAEPEPEPPLVPLTKITDPNNVFYTDENGVKYRVLLPPPGTRLKGADANSMSYTDDKGVQKEIYLPQGTVKTAWDHLENERWDELAKFEPYTGQGYTEEDFKAYEESHKQAEAQENK